MKRIPVFLVSVLTILLFSFSTNPAQAKGEWVRVESANFNMVGNAGEKEIRRAAVKLEQFREVFRTLFPKLKFSSPVPTNVVVFKNDKEFAPYKPVFENGQTSDWMAGYFLKGEDVNYIALSAEGEIERTFSVIFHEYTHFMVDNDIGRTRIPPWLNEGLAEYYEKFKIEDDRRITLGAINSSHLKHLETNRLIPFETFFNTDYYSLNRQGKDRVGAFYAQSWALMHYLMHADGGERRGQLNAFIDLLVGGKLPKDAFAEAFQSDYAMMLEELKKYLRIKRFNTSSATLKERLLVEDRMKSFPVAEAESKTILGDLLYRTKRFDEAAAHLKEALAQRPDYAQANMTLGLIRLRQNNLAEAKILLKKAVEAEGGNYLAHYQYAYVLSREKMTENGFVSGYDAYLAEEIKGELKKSIALNPAFAESYALYAFVSAVRNEDLDEAVGFINKALEIAPGNQKYLIRSSELFLRKEDFAKARAIARKVYETATDGEMRLYAQNTLSKINSTEAQLEEIKNYKKKPRNEAETDKPLTEEEIARRTALALNEAFNQALRRPAGSEKRALGYITRIECAGKNIEFSFKVENNLLKFYTPDFESLFLMSYSSESSDTEIGCGTIKKDVFAVITYRPSENAKAKSEGQIVAIEFMPQTFKLTN